jgi:hypothetical protein
VSLLERIPVTLNHFSRVMAGQQPVEDGRERPYVQAIHALSLKLSKKDVDARDKRRA